MAAGYMFIRSKSRTILAPHPRKSLSPRIWAYLNAIERRRGNWSTPVHSAAPLLGESFSHCL
jgi:hypothetical protein